MEELIKELKKILTEKRFAHTMGVAETAKKLAEHYNLSGEKAYLAGLLHDNAKNLPADELYRLSDYYKINLDDVAKKEPSLLHAYVGAHLIKDRYGISDEEIFDAVYYHTTGKEDMSLFSKIIFLSDLIEPGRYGLDFLDEARALSHTDIDKALILTMEGTIKYVIKKGGLLHPDTVKARNFLIESRKD